jgi:transcription elongation factor GreA
MQDVDSGDERVLMIVGADESDVDRGWISLESPLGRGLIGKELGDIAKIQLPGGVKEFEILELYVNYEDDSSDTAGEGESAEG